MPESRRTGLTRLYSGLDRFAAAAAAPRWRSWRRSPDSLSSLTAVSAQAQTLTDALAEAYNTNPQLLAQRALLRATDEQVPQALSFWRPTGHLHRPGRHGDAHRWSQAEAHRLARRTDEHLFDMRSPDQTSLNSR